MLWREALVSVYLKRVMGVKLSSQCVEVLGKQVLELMLQGHV